MLHPDAELRGWVPKARTGFVVWAGYPVDRLVSSQPGSFSPG